MSDLPPEVDPKDSASSGAGRRRRRPARGKKGKAKVAATPAKPEVVPDTPLEAVFEEGCAVSEACTRRIVFLKVGQGADGMTMFQEVEETGKTLTVTDPTEIPEAIGRIRKQGKISDGDRIMVVEVLHLYEAETRLELVDKLRK